MKKTAPLLILVAGCLWGSMGVFVRGLAAYEFGSMDIVLFRVLGAACLLGLWLLLFDREKLRIRGRDLWCFIGTGIVSIVFFNYCYFSTIRLTSLSVAATMLYIAPAVVTAGGILLFGESFRPVKLLALAMALGGCVLVTGVLSSGTKLTVMGILLGVGSGVGYAMYSIFGRYALMRGYHSVTISFYTFLFATLGAVWFAEPIRMIRTVTDRPECLGLILGLIVLNTLAAYVCYTLGLANMEAGTASIIATIEPVVAALIGFLLYKERMEPLTGLGVILVLLSAVVVNLPGAAGQSRRGENG